MSRSTGLSTSAMSSINNMQHYLRTRVNAPDRNALWISTAAAIVALPLLWKLLYLLPGSLRRSISPSILTDARDTDPSILKKHSMIRAFHVLSTGFTYPGIRVVYRDHPQAEKLPKDPSPLPLLVFVHGLGGSAAQFAPLLTSLINVGPCLSIDLPGCGRSDFAPEEWEAYTQPALAALLAVIVESYRNAGSDQRVIFIAHSMGCSLSARVASGETGTLLSEHVAGLVALCPRAADAPESRVRAIRRLTCIPAFLFDIFRRIDRSGGVNSSSVNRFVGPDAAGTTKRLQYRYNVQSKTDVFRRMLYGTLPTGIQRSKGKDGLANYPIWNRIEAPIFLIGGESDNLAPSSEVRSLASFLSESKGSLPHVPHVSFEGVAGDGNARHGVKMAILPAPASHALLFAPEQCRVVSGLIQGFLADFVDKRLSLGWQLQYLSKEGKWDVKNLEKWAKIKPVSEQIGGIFRAMKTMREVDEIHNPKAVAAEWNGRIRAIIDISHEAPVYDPKKLDAGGIEYHKFPTVSKLPPTAEETHSFNDLVDSLRLDGVDSGDKGSEPIIAVHCHYGFNRTGYFVICYLVDRMNWRLQDAIQEFATKRPPGVKHQHFIDELYVRYCSGLGGGP